MGLNLPEGELEISGSGLFQLICGSVIGGIVGALGLGGGVVFNPVLLDLGVPPTVVAATGMFLIMYSQASNTAIYILVDYLPINFALWIGMCSCFGILAVMVLLTRLIQSTGRHSIIVLILALTLLASAAMVPFFSVP